MAVKLERQTLGRLLLTFGPECGCWFLESEIAKLETVIFLWRYETEKKSRKPKSIVYNDDGTTTITRIKGE